MLQIGKLMDETPSRARGFPFEPPPWKITPIFGNLKIGVIFALGSSYGKHPKRKAPWEWGV